MGKQWKQWQTLFLGAPVTADSDCSHEIKRCLLLGRNAMINLDSILKSRDITLQTKVRIVKAMVFPVVMYACESWTIKNAEHQRLDGFELCWRRFLRVPWTARRLNQSILMEIKPAYLMERLMLKLKLQYFAFVSMLQYFGQPMWEASSLDKTLMLGNIEGKRSRQQRMRWLDSITDSMDMNLSILCLIVDDKGAWHAAVHGVTKSWTWLSDWVRTTRFSKFIVGKITFVIPVTMESSSPFLFRNFINVLYSCNKRADSTWPREQSWRPTWYNSRLNGNPPKCMTAC